MQHIQYLTVIVNIQSSCFVQKNIGKLYMIKDIVVLHILYQAFTWYIVT